MSEAVYRVYETINDYLDLLGYAKQINDVEWQQDIIAQLKQLQNQNAPVENLDMKTKLWDRLDEINTNMVSLFLAISQSSDEEEKGVLLYALQELKKEQISISEKIKAQ
ncbi:hypothetical protein D3C77_287310 [compost metagenome]